MKAGLSEAGGHSHSSVRSIGAAARTGRGWIMMMRWLKWSSAFLASSVVLGMFCFGTDLPSYISSSTRQVRSAVKESVPIDFELQRARDLLDAMLPEIRTKVRLIAHEEVEVAALKQEIARDEKQLLAQSDQLRRLRATLDQSPVSSVVAGQNVSRPQALERLGRQFEQYKEGQNLLASKRELLQVREKSLAAALESLEKVRSRKALLEQKIDSLAAQHRLLKARSASTPLDLDPGQLARAGQLLDQLQKRLDVATRVLQHELQLAPEPEPVIVDPDELLSEVDRYLQSPTGQEKVAMGPQR
jgi:DNA repair exonuclease SbcCD ATPase subunit